MSILNNVAGLILKPYIKELSRARLPKIDGEVFIKGLRDDVEIIRDEWGIAHIYANNINDLLFAQGFTHAQDRLFQMEMNRKVARGRLSEIVGKKGLDTDRIARTMGYERVAKQDWDLFGDDEQQLIIDYCNGVNAYLKSEDFKLPVEFKLLKHEPEPWEPMDIASFSRLLSRTRTNVFIDKRLAGGVAIIDKSRMPAIDIFSVRGIGVAVSANTSTSARRAFSVSFCFTPKRCSSSRITKPSSVNFTSDCSSLCVPIRMSTLPSASFLMTSFCSFVVLKRLNTSILNGYSAKRSQKDS